MATNPIEQCALARDADLSEPELVNCNIQVYPRVRHRIPQRLLRLYIHSELHILLYPQTLALERALDVDFPLQAALNDLEPFFADARALRTRTLRTAFGPMVRKLKIINDGLNHSLWRTATLR